MFGVFYGFDALPKILDSEDFRDNVLEKDMNLYCVASPKANRWTGMVLAEQS